VGKKQTREELGPRPGESSMCVGASEVFFNWDVKRQTVCACGVSQKRERFEPTNTSIPTDFLLNFFSRSLCVSVRAPITFFRTPQRALRVLAESPLARFFFSSDYIAFGLGA
jgi:hypothetical protein